MMNFDKFTYKKGENVHEYYLRFTLLLNDMNIYKMPLEQFQVNTKFLNTLPDEWSKFVTDVKLVKDLHTTNVDQLHAHLQQHERHANEVRLMHERNPESSCFSSSHQLTQHLSISSTHSSTDFLDVSKLSTVITTHNAAYQADDLDALTLIVMNSFSQDIALMGPILKEWLQMHSLRNSKKLDDSDSVCVHSNDCMSSDNECVSNA
ncbi:hypothetical protein Tco_0771482 [Tanacetum coccineum]|uniref:Integrase, catalytic region, zinc finger, CCHC-type, peptidase aspartic, catalytic n=1 Tax=Tanacetum coccineum TaxID=301880 RepID=A0ABQ4ZHS2_9ASTR